MLRVLVVILAFSPGSFVLADQPLCPDNQDVSPEVSQLAILNTHLLPIRLESPQSDLALRLEHGDFRFIAIGGFSMTYPGLRNRELLCTYGFRYIAGTSDALESKEHNQLVQAFTTYAKEYNMLLEAELAGE